MGNLFARWLASFLLFFFCPSFLFCEENWWWEGDTSLILSADEPERLVSMTGELTLRIENRDPEDPEQGTVDRWVIKMNPESFEVACRTPVHAAFHSPGSIRESFRCHELELTGNFDKKWLREHIGQAVTLSGYLWHAHTHHHYTPVMMDTDPWFK
jgi:hypothetical protein